MSTHKHTMRGASINFTQARPILIEGLLKRKVLPPNLGETAVLPDLTMVALLQVVRLTMFVLRRQFSTCTDDVFQKRLDLNFTNDVDLHQLSLNLIVKYRFSLGLSFHISMCLCKRMYLMF